MKKLVINKQNIVDMLKKKWGLILVEVLIFAFIITLDLCMKEFLYEFLASKSNLSMTVVAGFLDLTYSENTGAGFGILSGSTLALTILTTIVIIVILLYLVIFHSDGEFLRIPLVMVAAGGIGNLVDRIELGYVRDFFEFTFVKFAIFNIADAFVTIGAILLVVCLIYMMYKESKKSKKKFAEENAKADLSEDESNAAENFTVEDIENIQSEANSDNLSNKNTERVDLDNQCADDKQSKKAKRVDLDNQYADNKQSKKAKRVDLYNQCADDRQTKKTKRVDLDNQCADDKQTKNKSDSN